MATCALVGVGANVTVDVGLFCATEGAADCAEASDGREGAADGGAGV